MLTGNQQRRESTMEPNRSCRFVGPRTSAQGGIAMPQFKVRDLMINLMTEGGRGQVPLCRGVSLPNCAFHTCVGFSDMGGGVGCLNNVSFCRVTLVADTC